MKIHRQPQEDWTDRQLQHQLLTQRLALTRPASLMPSQSSNLLSPQAPGLTFAPSGLAGTPSSSSSADNDLSSAASSSAVTPRNVLDSGVASAYSSITASNSHAITSINAGDSNQPTPVLPFHQSWGSFGHSPDPAVFFCNTDGKDHAGARAV